MTRSTSGISSPLAATSVATKHWNFPSLKLCRHRERQYIKKSNAEVSTGMFPIGLHIIMRKFDQKSKVNNNDNRKPF